MDFVKRLSLVSVGPVTTAVTIPMDFIEAQALQAGLTIPQFRERYQAVAHYNGSEEITYTFEKIPN